MTRQGQLQVVFYVLALPALVRPLGGYIARVYESRPLGLDRVLGWLERLIYRAAGVRPGDEMGWRTYALAMLTFNLVGLLWLYGLQRVQGTLPLNPERLGAVAPDLAFNTAAGFVTTTDWQSYAGETTMSYLSQGSVWPCRISWPRRRAWPSWPPSSGVSRAARHRRSAISGST